MLPLACVGYARCVLPYTVDFSTFKGSVGQLAKCAQIPGDFAKTQTRIQILGDSDAGGPGITVQYGSYSPRVTIKLLK